MNLTYWFRYECQSVGLTGQAMAKNLPESSSLKHIENPCLCCSWEGRFGFEQFFLKNQNNSEWAQLPGAGRALSGWVRMCYFLEWRGASEATQQGAQTSRLIYSSRPRSPPSQPTSSSQFLPSWASTPHSWAMSSNQCFFRGICMDSSLREWQKETEVVLENVGRGAT